MTINNPDEYVNNLWDWGILRGCFGETKIEPTDIDGLVERNGKFLVIETKAPGVEVKQGQMITFKSLANLGCFTVMIIWGEANKPSKVKLILRDGQIKDYEIADINKVRDITTQWFKYADNKPGLPNGK